MLGSDAALRDRDYERRRRSTLMLSGPHVGCSGDESLICCPVDVPARPSSSKARRCARPERPRYTDVAVRILPYQPTRRVMLRTLLTAVVGAPVLARLGRVLDRQPRLVRPEDLPPIPWIGHY